MVIWLCVAAHYAPAATACQDQNHKSQNIITFGKHLFRERIFFHSHRQSDKLYRAVRSVYWINRMTFTLSIYRWCNVATVINTEYSKPESWPFQFCKLQGEKRPKIDATKNVQPIEFHAKCTNWSFHNSLGFWGEDNTVESGNHLRRHSIYMQNTSSIAPQQWQQILHSLLSPLCSLWKMKTRKKAIAMRCLWTVRLYYYFILY